MNRTPCSMGFLVAFFTLVVTGIYLDEPVILAAGIATGLFILMQAILFLHKAQEIIQKASCSRTPERTLVRQGRQIHVHTEVRIRIPSETKVTYKESAPLFCNIISGNQTVSQNQPGEHTFVLDYRVIPHYHGTVTFPGGTIFIADRFFTASYLLSNEAFRGPVLHIQPWPMFEQGRISGTKEFDRLGLEKGYSIRMHREYVPGDDLRHIDWKLSAKRGKLYVREYSTQLNDEPMIIVDLPDRDQVHDTIGFSRMVGSVSGFIESTLAKKIPLSLLFISGANMTDVFYKGGEVSRCLPLLRDELHPRVRIHHLYRRRKRADVRKKIRRMEQYAQNLTENSPEQQIVHHINELHHRHLVHAGTMQFSVGMARIFSSHRMSEVIVYSLCDGDTSHIEEIASMAHRQNIPFRVRTPAVQDSAQKRPVPGEIIEVM